MKYLKIKTIALALALPLLAAACGGDKGNSKGNNNNVSISIAASSVKALYGKSTIIQVTTANTDFTVTAPPGSGCAKRDSAGIACNPAAAGSYLVTATATADTSKYVTVTVSVPEAEIESGGLSTGSDGKPELKLSADEAESDPITLYAAGGWTAEVIAGAGGDIPDWIGLKDSSDVGGSSIVKIQAEGSAVSQISGAAGIVKIAVTLDPNYSGQERRATVIITIGSTNYEITVTQSPTAKGGNANLGDEVSVNISPSTIDVMAGEPKTFTVTMAKTDDFTLSVSPASGSGCVKDNGNVTCTPAVAGKYEITVTATSNTSKLSKATLDVLGFADSGELAFYADDTQSGQIAFYAPGDWTAEVKDPDGDTPSWISLSATSGTAANNTISLTLGLNYSGVARTAVVTVSVNGKDMELTVVQQPTTSDGANLGDEVSINIYPASESVLLGKTQTFDVTAIETDFTFSVAPTSGNGCERDGDKIVCEPTLADTYIITVTAVENPSKTSAATLEAKEAQIGVSPEDAGDVDLLTPIIFTVTAENTDFSFDVSPETGHGCERDADSDEITCTPTLADTYEITITADEDDTKTATATFIAIIPEELKITLNETLDIEMVRVEAGTFTMGCSVMPHPELPFILGNVLVGFDNTTVESHCNLAGRPMHTVTLTEDYYIGKYAVTQEEWEAVMGEENNPSPAANKDNKRIPIVNVSWLDAQEFISELNERDAGKGWVWRLPTEAEWEYAAGGGHKESNCQSYVCMYNGTNESMASWFNGTVGGGKIYPVDVLPFAYEGINITDNRYDPNELGLYNMVGNTWEWTNDIYGPYSAEDQVDPPGASSSDENPQRVYRGGAFNVGLNSIFSRAGRAQDSITIGVAGNNLGFRLALTLTAPGE